MTNVSHRLTRLYGNKILFHIISYQDNPELLPLVAAQRAADKALKDASAESTDSPTVWREFAIQTFHKRLLKLDVTQLKNEAKLAQKRIAYFDQCVPSLNYTKKITLSGSKSELITRLAEEAYEFLQAEDILYTSPEAPNGTCYEGIHEDVSDASDDPLAASDGDSISLGVGDEDSDAEPQHVTPRPTIAPAARPVADARIDVAPVTTHTLILSSQRVAVPPGQVCDVILSSSEEEDGGSDTESSSSICVVKEDEVMPSMFDKKSNINPLPSSVGFMSIDAVRMLCFGFDSFRPGQRCDIYHTVLCLLLYYCFFLPSVLIAHPFILSHFFNTCVCLLQVGHRENIT